MAINTNAPYYERYTGGYHIIDARDVESTLRQNMVGPNDPHLYRTFGRYITAADCKLALSDEGNLLTVKRGRRGTLCAVKTTIRDLLRISFAVNRRLQQTADGYKAACLEEDEEELSLLMEAAKRGISAKANIIDDAETAPIIKTQRPERKLIETQGVEKAALDHSVEDEEKGSSFVGFDLGVLV